MDQFLRNSGLMRNSRICANFTGSYDTLFYEGEAEHGSRQRQHSGGLPRGLTASEERRDEVQAPLRPAAMRLPVEDVGPPVGRLLILQRDGQGRIVKTPYREQRLAHLRRNRLTGISSARDNWGPNPQF